MPAREIRSGDERTRADGLQSDAVSSRRVRKCPVLSAFFSRVGEPSPPQTIVTPAGCEQAMERTRSTGRTPLGCSFPQPLSTSRGCKYQMCVLRDFVMLGLV